MSEANEGRGAGLALSCLGAPDGQYFLAQVPDLGSCFRYTRCWRASCNGEAGVIRVGCGAGALNGVWEWEMIMEAKNLGINKGTRVRC